MSLEDDKKARAHAALVHRPQRPTPSPCGTNRNLRCSTKPHVAHSVWKRVRAEVGEGVESVWDAFAGIGTDTIQASRHFSRVLATECDPPTFHRLRENARAAALPTRTLPSDCGKSAVLRLADCLAVAAAGSLVAIDLLYFDPPWGHAYHRTAYADIRLPGEGAPTLAQAYERLCAAANPTYVLVKLPARTPSTDGPWMQHGCVAVTIDEHRSDGVVFFLVKLAK